MNRLPSDRKKPGKPITVAVTLLTLMLLFSCGTPGEVPSSRDRDVQQGPFTEVGDWPSIHHDSRNSGVLPGDLVAPREFRLRWSALENVSVISPPVIGDDGRVYVTATSENFRQRSAGLMSSRLYALDEDTGEIEWLRTEIWQSGMAGAPLLIRSAGGELSIVVSGMGKVIAYRGDGSVRWQSDLRMYEVSISSHLSPDGESIVLGTNKGAVYLKDPATGDDLLPYFSLQGTDSTNTPAVTREGTVILIGVRISDPKDGVAWAVRPDIEAGTWETQWTFEDIEGESQTSPTVNDACDRVYIGDGQGGIIAIATDGGHEIWRYVFEVSGSERYLAYASVASTPEGLLATNLVPRDIDWQSLPKYIGILEDLGDHAELRYLQDWEASSGVSYSVGSGRFYFTGKQRNPSTGAMDNVLASLDYHTGAYFTQPLENQCMNNVTLADGAIIVPIFWGGFIGLPMITTEGYGVHYYEAVPGSE